MVRTFPEFRVFSLGLLRPFTPIGNQRTSLLAYEVLEKMASLNPLKRHHKSFLFNTYLYLG